MKLYPMYLKVIASNFCGWALGAVVIASGLAAFEIAWSSPVRAEAPRDGGLLLTLCVSGDNRDRHMCEGYLMGVLDTALFYQRANVMPRVVCLPATYDLAEVKQAVIKNTLDHPGVRQYAASQAVIAAVMGRWPCPVSK